MLQLFAECPEPPDPVVEVEKDVDGPNDEEGDATPALIETLLAGVAVELLCWPVLGNPFRQASEVKATLTPQLPRRNPNC